jgi:DNA polymerase III subunit gamma/tau
MAYKALYRKWRPEVFEEVIGQTQIIRTLKNQVQTQSISHAYMFSGIRGTGKTSTAKIFARSINCLNPHEGDPCNVCEACRSILSEQMMDVLEIDAASNNGVDHIRELRESVKYPPVKGRYKVYIIDEVHMLSTGAFNALLKTLEEPPDHVVFILATTELHKIPATVLSRCLRFTFKPLGLDEISERLVTICRSLGIEYEEAAITTIALNGEGALRDALSILDQCLAYNPGELRYDQVIDVLGSINEALLFKLAAHIGNHEPLEAVKLVHELYLDGKDLKQLVTDTMKHFRWLLMASLNATVEGWGSLPESTREQFLMQSKLFSTENLTSIIRQLADTEYLMKRSAQPQLMLENNLIALCAPQQSTNGHVSADRQEHQLSEISEINERIGRIEQFLNRARSKKTQSAQPPPVQNLLK